MNHEAGEPKKGAHNGTGLYRQIADPCPNKLLEHVIQRRINQTGHDYGFRYNRQIYKYESYSFSIEPNPVPSQTQNYFQGILLEILQSAKQKSTLKNIFSSPRLTIVTMMTSSIS